MWRCPLCQQHLTQADSSYRCTQGHSFDIARAGYVNLLPVQNKKSRQPGDDKMMVRARESFHGYGSYSPLMQALGESIHSYTGHADVHLFDAGCGEGSYLKAVTNQLQNMGYSIISAGCDIAKYAVERAAKQNTEGHLAVASTFALPVIGECFDVVMSVFAPGDDGEYRRILKNDGLFIRVEPGPMHLYELKQMIYREPRQHQSHSNDVPGLVREDKSRVTFKLTFADDAHRNALLSMTPFYWKASEAVKQAISTSLETVTADFTVNIWRKVGADGGQQ